MINFDFCTLLNGALAKALKPENIQSGFHACGIYPLNVAEIPDDAYMPNAIYSVSHLLANRKLLNTAANGQLPVEREKEITADQKGTANAHLLRD